jgi:hypothetical protein
MHVVFRMEIAYHVQTLAEFHMAVIALALMLAAFPTGTGRPARTRAVSLMETVPHVWTYAVFQMATTQHVLIGVVFQMEMD